ncbi:MAG: YggS family pyridoxal phosphate-dependent enzyme [Candidatus Zixiibacteriota bacterium]|nr:MAG: YggS family pyridoxal phosphate-dependent enzyme [candidate division Zixibacteria bacterium]
MKDIITRNLTELHGQIADACEEHDRDMDDITIVAVTKAHPASIIRTSVACGLHNIGESRVQEAEGKIREVGQIARYHLVGHLQSNKVRKAVQIFDVIQSVDSFKLAAEINRRAAEADRTIECYVQVNITGDPQKHGVAPEDTLGLLDKLLPLSNMNMCGLMAIGPYTEDLDAIRQAYRRCYELFVHGRRTAGKEFDTLSMGMTDDFREAIAEGSTMIRVGTAIFGQRPPR